MSKDNEIKEQAVWGSRGLWPSRADTGAKAEAEAVLCLVFAGRREVGGWSCVILWDRQGPDFVGP